MHHKRAASPCLEILEDRILLATCNVTRLADTGVGMGFRGDLRYCITKTNNTPGVDVIEFRVAGTINLQSVLPNINDGLVIFGPGVNDLTVRRDTGGNYRIFTVNDGITAEIYNLTATNGTGGILNLGTLTLGYSAVINNANTLVDGGGITNVGSLTVFETTISGNSATLSCNGEGGGIYNLTGATLNMGNSIVSGNTAGNTSFGCSGTNVSQGGGIFNGGTATIATSLIENNSVTCKSDQTKCQHRGGGIVNLSQMTISYSTISGNTVKGQHPVSDEASGAGIHSSGTLTVDSSTISSNVIGSIQTGFVFGGGISSNGTLTVINSTIAGNTGDAKQECRGGGIYINGGPANIRHSTIVGNFCGAEKFEKEGGGIHIAGNPIVNLRNSIVVANLAATSGPELFGVLTSSGFNIFGDPSGGSGYDSTDQLFVDPMLGPLGDNGGPTHTFALLPGSPAIDAGDNTGAPAFDQRGAGFPRIVDGTVDIGSFEVQATVVPGRESEARLMSSPPITHLVPRPQAVIRNVNEPTPYTAKLQSTAEVSPIAEQPGVNHCVPHGAYRLPRSAPAPADDPIPFVCFPV